MAWFPGYGDDDEFPDPDYGVFGDKGQELPLPPSLSKREQARLDRERLRREQERKVSRDFNSHMIDLFNQGRR